MKRYYVLSPSYDTVLDIICDGQGPMENVRDCIEVEAESSRDAIAFGVKIMLKDRDSKWCRDQRASGLSPYTGITAHCLDDMEEEWNAGL
jgi:hypothetical protein